MSVALPPSDQSPSPSPLPPPDKKSAADAKEATDFITEQVNKLAKVLSDVEQDKTLRSIYDPSELFHLEEAVRNRRDKTTTPLLKKTYQHLYDTAIVPLLERVTPILIDRLKLTSTAASGHGLSAQTVWRLLASPKSVLERYGDTRESVFLQPEGVIKESSHSSREEDEATNALLDMFSGGSLDTFYLKSTNRKRLGFSMPKEIINRAYQAVDFPKSQLSEKDRLAIDFYGAVDIYLYPDFQTEEQKKAYESCMQHRWRYTVAGVEKESNFKDLLLAVTKRAATTIICIPTVGKDAPSDQELNLALNPTWTVITPEIVKFLPASETSSATVQSLTNVQVKPFLSDIRLQKQLSEEAQETILKRLTPRSQFQTTLTVDLQFLDLHSGNLGFVPEATELYKKFAGLGENEFIYREPGQPEKRGFQNFLNQHLSAPLSPDTEISYIEKIGADKQWKKPTTLNNLLELTQVLDSRWELVLFDTNLTLGESNMFNLYQDRAHVPVRSGLLATKWKDQPLSDEVLQSLEEIDTETKSSELYNWMNRYDAPIYQQMDAEIALTIKAIIKDHLKDYSIRSNAKNIKKATKHNLKKEFVTNLANVATTTKFWKAMETAVSSVAVYPDDTYKTLADRHHQTVEQLMLLNPDVILPLPSAVGERTTRKIGTIRIAVNLTSQTKEAQTKRETIAAQLFPRLTIAQQEALLQRRQARRTYINHYSGLADLIKSNPVGVTESNEDMIGTLKDYLTDAVHPLTEDEVESFMNRLTSSPENTQQLCTELLSACQPTYFNLMKVMYPLLRDAFAFYEELHRQGNKTMRKMFPDISSARAAGTAIGDHRTPIDTMVAEVIQNPQNSPEWEALNKVAIRLALQISEANEADDYGFLAP